MKSRGEVLVELRHGAHNFRSGMLLFVCLHRLVLLRAHSENLNVTEGAELCQAISQIDTFMTDGTAP